MSHPLDNIPSLPHVLPMDYDVIIAGGGLNGLTLALALDSAGITTVVIDAYAPQESLSPKFDGRSYALSAASQNMLDALGLWEDLADHAEPMLEIKVSDGAAGETTSPFVMQFGDEDFSQGPMGYMVEDRYLRAHLAEAVEASNVVFRAGQTITGQTVHSTHVTVTVEGHPPLTAAVLVGADGRSSRTAKMAGLTRTGWDYNQSSLVCAIAHEKPHHGIAHQYFMPSGPLAILPLTQNRSGIVWTEQRQVAQDIHNLSDEDYLSILRPRFGDFLGEISLAGARYIYPLSLSTTHRMIATRVALIGDAAHAVHPMPGRGSILALKMSQLWPRCFATPSAEVRILAFIPRLPNTKNGADLITLCCAQRPTASTDYSQTTIRFCAAFVISAWGSSMPRPNFGQVLWPQPQAPREIHRAC